MLTYSSSSMARLHRLPASARLTVGCHSRRRSLLNVVSRAHHRDSEPSQRTSPIALWAALATTLAAAPALAEDAAVALSTSVVNDGPLAPIVNALDSVLNSIESVYLGWGLPYSYGWSIVTLTAFVKVLTLPLTKKQVESAMAVQNLKPRIDAIKARYGEDKDKISKETSRLYELAKVNPAAGCLPSIATIPIFIGLYKSLSNVANSGALDSEGFFWVPSLAGAPWLQLHRYHRMNEPSMHPPTG